MHWLAWICLVGLLGGNLAYQQPTVPNNLPDNLVAYLAKASLTPIQETAVSVRAKKDRNSIEIVIVEIPVPTWLSDSKKFSAKPDDVLAYRDKCLPGQMNNITFMPVVAISTVDKNSIVSSSGLQSWFTCTYVSATPRSFVQCTFRSMETSRNINDIALLAMVSNCSSLQAFSDAMDKGHSNQTVLVLIIVLPLVAFLGALLFCAYREYYSHPTTYEQVSGQSQMSRFVV